jgi:hypothetical protein
MRLGRQAIEAAVERVLAGEAPADVVATSVLSKTTLSKYVAMFRAQGLIVIKKRGAKPALQPEVEADIVSWVAAMQRLGVPPEQQDIIIKASEILGVTTRCGS